MHDFTHHMQIQRIVAPIAKGKADSLLTALNELYSGDLQNGTPKKLLTLNRKLQQNPTWSPRWSEWIAFVHLAS